MNRRVFLSHVATATAASTMPSLLRGSAGAREVSHPKGKAEHCIFIWLGGGMSQIDTFDPKRLGDAKKKQAGSAYPAIQTAVSGVAVCEHLRRTAKLMDRITILRTVHHDVIDEHAAAVNR